MTIKYQQSLGRFMTEPITILERGHCPATLHIRNSSQIVPYKLMATSSPTVGSLCDGHEQ